MHVTSSEMLSWVQLYLWPFVRIAALMSVAPVFGTRTVPMRIRLGIALVLTLVVVPTLPPFPRVDPLSVTALLVTVQQLLAGLVMGFALTLVFSALITGGQVAAQLMGLGFASMMDPQNGVSVPVVGQFYTIVATLLFLVFDGHLVLIEMVNASFASLPVGQTMPAGNYWRLAAWGYWVFAGAVLVALPSIAALLMVNMAFGVLTRAAPQLNIFSVGFPATILFGFMVMLASLPYFVPKFSQLLESAYVLISQLLSVA
ncbi:MAG TPA: flagellar biosynthetic protein FliR [Gammaproteobacteria bacterium]|nr:flagellar biosynthetic protein FliR [Gammaproteobacteria bacterium]